MPGAIRAYASGFNLSDQNITPRQRLTLILFVFLADVISMTSWSEDVSQFTLEQVLALRMENRAWYKELRQQTDTLMDSKLAKQITHEDYAIQRKLGNEAAAECQRRGAILAREVLLRVQRT